VKSAGDRVSPVSLPARTITSPVGALTLVADRSELIAVLWPDDRAGRVILPPLHDQPDEPVLAETAAQIDAYFARRLTRFDLPLGFRGTVFQQRVWAALLTIPYGETRSYAAIAAQIGSPTAARAVGAANGRNPISIIAPCHRVIGAGGRLTGFAGGLTAKGRLLALESASPGLPLD
jgi:methylated-DNA-[protein]-cysteine S-methyltransferase